MTDQMENGYTSESDSGDKRANFGLLLHGKFLKIIAHCCWECYHWWKIKPILVDLLKPLLVFKEILPSSATIPILVVGWVGYIVIESSYPTTHLDEFKFALCGYIIRKEKLLIYRKRPQNKPKGQKSPWNLAKHSSQNRGNWFIFISITQRQYLTSLWPSLLPSSAPVPAPTGM